MQKKLLPEDNDEEEVEEEVETWSSHATQLSLRSLWYYYYYSINVVTTQTLCFVEQLILMADGSVEDTPILPLLIGS